MSPIEKLIARTAARRLWDAGYFLTVDYDRGFEPSNARGMSNANALGVDGVIEAMNAVDECWLMVHRTAPKFRNGQPTEPYDAFVYFIWGNGNEGRDCISDYSTSLAGQIDGLDDAWANAQIDRAFAALDGLPRLLECIGIYRHPEDWPQRMRETLKEAKDICK